MQPDRDLQAAALLTGLVNALIVGWRDAYHLFTFTAVPERSTLGLASVPGAPQMMFGCSLVCPGQVKVILTMDEIACGTTLADAEETMERSEAAT